MIADTLCRNIVGLNKLRMHGLEPAEVMRRIAGDEFARERARGVPAPWSALREPVHVAP